MLYSRLQTGVPGPGGVTTPAAAMGDALIVRLREAGIVIDVSS